MDEPNLFQNESEASAVAESIFRGEYGGLPISSDAHVVSFLGGSGPRETLVCKLYLRNHFNFVGLGVLPALRRLSSKLVLKGNKFCLDKLLNEFAQCYIECLNSSASYNSSLLKNPSSQFLDVANSDCPFTWTNICLDNAQKAHVIHVVAYSILLLNADLSGSHAQMTLVQFIGNTIRVLQENHLNDNVLQKLSSVLEGIYNSLKSEPLKFPDSKFGFFNDGESVIDDLDKMKLKSSRFSIRTRTSFMSSITSVSKFMRTGTQALNRFSSSFRNRSTDREKMAILEESEIIRQDKVKRKNVLECGERAQNRSWRNCMLQLTRSEIRMVFGSNNVEIISACHCLACHGCMETNDSLYECKREHVFSLKTPKNTVYYFSCESNDDVSIWVRSMNLINAQNSVAKVDIMSGNWVVPYGWEYADGESNATLKQVGYWREQPPIMQHSKLAPQAQRDYVLNQATVLQSKYEDHLKRSDFVISIQDMAVRNAAMENWTRKLYYLKQEFEKWKTYAAVFSGTCDSATSVVDSECIDRMEIEQTLPNSAESDVNIFPARLHASVSVKDELCDATSGDFSKNIFHAAGYPSSTI